MEVVTFLSTKINIYNLFFIIFIIFESSFDTLKLKEKKDKWVIFLIINLGNIKYKFIIRKMLKLTKSTRKIYFYLNFFYSHQNIWFIFFSTYIIFIFIFIYMIWLIYNKYE